MRIEFESKYMINAAKSSGVPDGNRKNFFLFVEFRQPDAVQVMIVYMKIFSPEKESKSHDLQYLSVIQHVEQ